MSLKILIKKKKFFKFFNKKSFRKNFKKNLREEFFIKCQNKMANEFLINIATSTYEDDLNAMFY